MDAKPPSEVMYGRTTLVGRYYDAATERGQSGPWQFRLLSETIFASNQAPGLPGQAPSDD
jgi:hypothetical protein